MFISKKDLENLKQELRAEFNGMILEAKAEMMLNLRQTLENWELKPRPKAKKSVK